MIRYRNKIDSKRRKYLLVANCVRMCVHAFDNKWKSKQRRRENVRKASVSSLLLSFAQHPLFLGLELWIRIIVAISYFQLMNQTNNGTLTEFTKKCKKTFDFVDRQQIKLSSSHQELENGGRLKTCNQTLSTRCIQITNMLKENVRWGWF